MRYAAHTNLFLYCFALWIVPSWQKFKSLKWKLPEEGSFCLKQTPSVCSVAAWTPHPLGLVAGFLWGSLSPLPSKLPSTSKLDSRFWISILFHFFSVFILNADALFPLCYGHNWDTSSTENTFLRQSSCHWHSVFIKEDNAAASVLRFFFSLFLFKRKKQAKMSFWSTESIGNTSFVLLGKGRSATILLIFWDIGIGSLHVPRKTGQELFYETLIWNISFIWKERCLKVVSKTHAYELLIFFFSFRSRSWLLPASDLLSVCLSAACLKKTVTDLNLWIVILIYNKTEALSCVLYHPLVYAKAVSFALLKRI